MKNFRRLIFNNVYFILGFFIGIYMQYIIFNVGFRCDNYAISKELEQFPKEQVVMNSVIDTNKILKKIVSNSNNSEAKKKKKLIRPRYYSTELGIREKLFVGIFTSDDKVNSRAIHLNRTIAHLVNKIKFFITAQYKLKTKFNLTGLVGFTDTRSKYRPFQIFKYVSDNFGQEYDYYFLSNDFTYINIHRLKDVVNKISVSMDVYMGTRLDDSSFCNLDAGIIISNSVLKAIREKLDWCVLNTVTESHSENIGRCVYNSIGLDCQEIVQNQKLTTFKLKHSDLEKSLYNLSKLENFKMAASVYPVLQEKDYYRLNMFYIKQKLKELDGNEQNLASELTDSWPPGHKLKIKPATRFDVPRQLFFNMTHVFFPDDFTNVRPHNKFELLDLQDILEQVQLKAAEDHEDLIFKKLLNGYKIFDASRGMDYVLDLQFYDKKTSNFLDKRFEVCKPLSKVEFLPVPYVTENKKITIFLIIQEHERNEAKIFLNSYLNIMNDKKDENFLMLIFLYQNSSISQGKNDVFHEIKNFARKTAAMFKDETKIAWVSIRIPSTVYTTNVDVKSLNFVAVDLALKKIGVNNLVLILDSYCNVTKDFLNRVRMNTIENFQIFSPIPFRQYNPKISEHVKLEIHKNAGHFDREEYKYVSFFAIDYVQARKKYLHKIPIVRSDNDITTVLKEIYRNTGNIFEMFVETMPEFRHMRATDMNFLIRYHEEMDMGKCNKFLGNKSQLAKFLLSKKNLIPLLNE